jgi:parallel beta-helix repeat protein
MVALLNFSGFIHFPIEGVQEMKQAIRSSILGFVFCLACQIPLNAATPVTSHIMTSTTWTKANSPYVISSDILVAKGAILTIEPGVEVQFVSTTGGKVTAATTDNTDLIIQGGLRAIGDEANPIVFGPAVAGSMWGAIFFYNSDPAANSTLQNCMIKGGKVSLNYASPTISKCAIFGGRSGIEVVSNSNAQILNNRITANGAGIILWSATCNPVINKNEIYNNNYGLYIKDLGTPDISGNAVYSNRKYNVVYYSPKPLAMPGNDFRMVDAAQIEQLIYDGYDNPQLGKVDISGYIGQPAGTTPTAVMAQATPTAKVEQPKLDNEEELWGYGRPFEAMRIDNMDKKKKNSNVFKVIAVGATAAATGILLLL